MCLLRYLLRSRNIAIPSTAHRKAATPSPAINPTCDRCRLDSASEEGCEVGIDEDVDNIGVSDTMALADETVLVSPSVEFSKASEVVPVIATWGFVYITLTKNAFNTWSVVVRVVLFPSESRLKTTKVAAYPKSLAQ